MIQPKQKITFDDHECEIINMNSLSGQETKVGELVTNHLSIQLTNMADGKFAAPTLSPMFISTTEVIKKDVPTAAAIDSSNNLCSRMFKCFTNCTKN